MIQTEAVDRVGHFQSKYPYKYKKNPAIFSCDFNCFCLMGCWHGCCSYYCFCFYSLFYHTSYVNKYRFVRVNDTAIEWFYWPTKTISKGVGYLIRTRFSQLVKIGYPQNTKKSLSTLVWAGNRNVTFWSHYQIHYIQINVQYTEGINQTVHVLLKASMLVWRTQIV